MKKNLSSFFIGVLFALGLGISGMTQPQKVIGFLNLHHWDPSLLFVMVGAIAVHATANPLIMKRKSPLFDSEFHVPKKKEITPDLVFGAVLFGIGWGLGGYCPGPAIVSLASGQLAVFTFVLTMVAGMSLRRRMLKAKGNGTYK